jgi:hypothetical protein
MAFMVTTALRGLELERIHSPPVITGTSAFLLVTRFPPFANVSFSAVSRMVVTTFGLQNISVVDWLSSRMISLMLP